MTATCISGGIGYSSDESATSPMRQRSCGADVAVISSGLCGWNGGCSFSTHSQSSVCLPGPATSTAEEGGGGGGIVLSASVGGIHGTSFDGLGASSL